MSKNMYAGAKTHNTFVGCRFDCVYCRPTFQAQMKRQKHRCMRCYRYEPHEHPERLNKIPRSEIVFMCGDGDISFCHPNYTQQNIQSVRENTLPNQTVYFQSKNPDYFEQFEFPFNVIILTTLETNRDEGYRKYSKAPYPTTRCTAMMHVEHPRKGLTLEPLMDFDLEEMINRIWKIRPEVVWVGYNSRPKQVQLPEPPLSKTLELIDELKKFTTVRTKTLREADEAD